MNIIRDARAFSMRQNNNKIYYPELSFKYHNISKIRIFIITNMQFNVILEKCIN
ncbi:hypothetical protein C2G38_1435413 [Gigaspora rosea]|uniref:Uncharacterized protein n=1 Tax=Gigaspora rosea TaxID=44941 RepID=A0A397VBM0_9GLOM|nr:hypothetical protein C2G38_1435413 [Gigaspora rosea]